MTRPFTVDDLYLHRKVSKIHAVAGLDLAVAAVRSIDREADTYRTHLWQFALDTSASRQLTFGAVSDESLRLSPDGSQIAFLSSRGGDATQVFVMARDGGEPRQVGHFDKSVSDLRWMPDGKRLVVTASVAVDPDRRGERSDQEPPQRKPSSPEVAWRLPYKEDGEGYVLAREVHLFMLDVASGERRRLSDGPFDVQGFDVSADGTRIAYARTREGRYAHAYDLWVHDIDGGSHRRITFDHAMVMQPAWSPDGRHVAFTGAVEEADAEPQLWVVDVASGKVDALGGDEVDVGQEESLYWSADGTSIVFVRAWHGRHQLASITVPGGELSVLLGGDRQMAAFGCTDRRLVFSSVTPADPSEVWTCARDGSDERRISALNAWWAARMPIAVEARTFDVPDGQGGSERIEGWLLRADTGAAGPKPLWNDAHGGPNAFALLDYDTNVFWQVLCCEGWVVLALNAVGSASYGREFCQRINGHWGELDLPQHLAAIDALRNEGVCDERVAIGGKSYGGFLSAWAIGHTDAFRAAVVMAPVGDVETHYGTSDGGYYAQPFYIDTKPYFDRDVARRMSPLHHIERASTPTLFMQGKDDERCPKAQSEELFVSLYRTGRAPTELVLYPGETHGFLGEGTPSVREDASRRILAWAGRYALAHDEPRRHEPTEAAAI
ncbi:S9 family peptidase [Piscinibacter koreensis]|uniref:S9 family peptidase n=1 Tax=Piscinibacter koreensis TaxID=2742824 RepID=A0A7Y6NR74_9BURK|nr:S9 family peptidase [Schlegelella koreensis]NUZ07814.1 S9 family peptidase [Schlegelella koreensis]